MHLCLINMVTKKIVDIRVKCSIKKSSYQWKKYCTKHKLGISRFSVMVAQNLKYSYWKISTLNRNGQTHRIKEIRSSENAMIVHFCLNYYEFVGKATANTMY